MMPYKILQNQDFQSGIFIYRKRFVFENQYNGYLNTESTQA